MGSQRLVTSTGRSTARSLAWGQESLVPALKPGEIVIMDNLAAAITARLCGMLSEAGAKLFFMPKYSPDLNPIEQVFSKLKHGLRKAAARSYDAVLAAIGELLGSYPKGMRQLHQEFWM